MPDALWDKSNLNDPHAVADKRERVRRMFAAIAPSYDLNNRLWSGGTDQRWRKKAVKLSRLAASDTVVDVACGTGDLTLAYANAIRKLGGDATKQVIGVDYTHEMLPIAAKKDAALGYATGDAQNLPLPDASADVVSIAFGIRNVVDQAAAYREFRRVLRPGGRVMVLEFSKPTNPVIRAGYNFYFNHVLTRLAAAVARDTTGAYRYLASSVETFKTRQEMIADLETAGFADVRTKVLTFGVAVIYVGVAA